MKFRIRNIRKQKPKGIMPNSEINAVISACIDGSEKAQYKLYEYCYVEFFPSCRRYMNDDEMARECLNLGFHKVLQNLKTFDISRNFNAWARRIMITTSIDEWRKENKAIHTQLKEAIGYSVKRNDVDNYMEEQSVLYYLEFLPPMGKRVFSLYAIDGYKHREIAEMLSISESTSKWHVTEARKKLQSLLKKNELVFATQQ